MTHTSKIVDTDAGWVLTVCVDTDAGEITIHSAYGIGDDADIVVLSASGLSVESMWLIVETACVVIGRREKIETACHTAFMACAR